MFRLVARGGARAKFRKTLTKKSVSNFESEGRKILPIGTRIGFYSFPMAIKGLFPKPNYGGKTKKKEIGGKKGHVRIMVVHVFDSESLSHPPRGLYTSNLHDPPGPWSNPFFLPPSFFSFRLFFPAFAVQLHHRTSLSCVLLAMT